MQVRSCSTLTITHQLFIYCCGMVTLNILNSPILTICFCFHESEYVHRCIPLRHVLLLEQWCTEETFSNIWCTICHIAQYIQKHYITILNAVQYLPLFSLFTILLSEYLQILSLFFSILCWFFFSITTVIMKLYTWNFTMTWLFDYWVLKIVVLERFIIIMDCFTFILRVLLWYSKNTICLILAQCLWPLYEKG